jgi:hypothetical protein
MSTNAFTQYGNTVTFTAATSAPTPVQVTSNVNGNQYRIINSGNVVVFLGYGTSAANATSNAVVVTSSQASLPLLPGTDEILTFVPNAYFTGITSSGTASIYITNGDGM